MWAREIEIVLGVWLLLGPLVFGHRRDEVDLWFTDLACGLLIVLAALLSHWRRLRYAHLASLLVAVWLIGSGWLAAQAEATPARQNHILVGLFLATFAVVPTFASEPPRSWAEFYRAQPRRDHEPGPDRR